MSGPSRPHVWARPVLGSGPVPFPCPGPAASGTQPASVSGPGLARSQGPGPARMQCRSRLNRMQCHGATGPAIQRLSQAQPVAAGPAGVWVGPAGPRSGLIFKKPAGYKVRACQAMKLWPSRSQFPTQLVMMSPPIRFQGPAQTVIRSGLSRLYCSTQPVTGPAGFKVGTRLVTRSRPNRL